MTRATQHGRDVSPNAGMYPIQSLDFEQVQVQVQLAPLTPQGISAYHEAEARRIRELVDGRESVIPRRAVVIVDGSNQLIPPADVRDLQAKWMKANMHLLRTVVHSMGIVIINGIARGAFTAVTWALGERMPWPVVAHPDLETAVAWAIREVESIGGTVSEELLTRGVSAIEERRRALHQEFDTISSSR